MKNTILLLLLFVFATSDAQQWEDNLLEKNPNANYLDKKEAFDNYRKKVEYTKGNGYKPYARNLDFILKRSSNGEGIPNEQLYREWLKEKEKINNLKSTSNSNWIELGPVNTPIILSNGKKRGNGRINCIAFDPFDKNIIWVGSPGGGLWKSTDGGNSWSTNTDNLPVIGVSYIAINPTNPQEMYITTGDAHASDTYSIGILKSIDGGVTWDTTGIQFPVPSNKMVNKLLIHPTYTDSLFAATDERIMISPDGGQSWSIAQNSSGSNLIGRFRDIEFKPNDPNVLYAVKQTTGSSEVFKSTDRGLSWFSSSNGISIVNRNRPLIAVTPANPDVVYVLFCKNDYSFHGLYKSVDNANSWTLQSDSPNILGRATDGTGTGGQSWYDLSLGVSTEDENLLYVGGINLWRSTDGGVNWNISGSSGNGSNYSYMHVDQHCVEFNPLNGIAYAGNDGGLYEYMDTLNSWVDIVSVDCGVYKNGFNGDSAYTFKVGEVSNQVNQLLEVTKESLNKAIEQCVEGNRIGDIGSAVQTYAESYGYGIVRELVGHGLGKDLHEAPEVPNYGKAGRGLKLKSGLVIAIEPMVTMGDRRIKQLRDGWSIVTFDGLPAAHFEHDVAIINGKTEVLSTFKYIEEVLNK